MRVKQEDLPSTLILAEKRQRPLDDCVKEQQVRMTKKRRMCSSEELKVTLP